MCVILSFVFNRDIIRNSVHASEHDSVIFCGSGTTAAVHKLIHGLDFKEPPVSYDIIFCGSGTTAAVHKLIHGLDFKEPPVSYDIIFCGSGTTAAVHKLIHGLDFKDPPVCYEIFSLHTCTCSTQTYTQAGFQRTFGMLHLSDVKEQDVSWVIFSLN